MRESIDQSPHNNNSVEKSDGCLSHSPRSHSCGGVSLDFIDKETGERHLWQLRTCGRGDCPDCVERSAWRKQRDTRKNFHAFYEQHQSCVFAALRVSEYVHCVEEIAAAADELMRKLRLFMQRKAVHGVLSGYAWGVEVQHIDDIYHVHVHVIFAYKPSFASHARIKRGDMSGMLAGYFGSDFHYAYINKTERNPTLQAAVAAYLAYIAKVFFSVSEALGASRAEVVMELLLSLARSRKSGAGGILAGIFSRRKSSRPQPSVGDRVLKTVSGVLRETWLHGVRAVRKAARAVKAGKETYSEEMARLREAKPPPNAPPPRQRKRGGDNRVESVIDAFDRLMQGDRERAAVSNARYARHL